MIRENTIGLDGIITFWSLGEDTSRDVLDMRLGWAGLKSHLPERRTHFAALKDALARLYPAKEYLIQPLDKQGGFEVVHVRRGSEFNDYRHVLTAKADAQGFLEVSPYALRQPIAEGFERQMGRLTPAQVTRCLVGIVEELGGTRLRPSGGIYWLPSHHLPRWQEAAEAVRAAGAGENSLYVITHRMDAEAVRAVRDAIVAEVTAEAEKMHQEILSGGLGERALLHRQAEARRLRDKVRDYEEILGLALNHLHEAVGKAGEAAAAAAILASAGEEAIPA
jgi:hypothetical protein